MTGRALGTLLCPQEKTPHIHLLGPAERDVDLVGAAPPKPP